MLTAASWSGHVRGPSGGEVLAMLALAVHAEIPLEQLASMHYAYPTFHRGGRRAALATLV